jgi:hypothetical protein
MNVRHVSSSKIYTCEGERERDGRSGPQTARYGHKIDDRF